MFSRNNNTLENYNLEQKRNQRMVDYRFFDNSNTIMLQGNGLGIAKIHPKDLTNNYVDVDSFLKGIGSCNFIQPKTLQYQPKKNTFLHMEQRQPILLPTPFVISSERPGFT